MSKSNKYYDCRSLDNLKNTLTHFFDEEDTNIYKAQDAKNEHYKRSSKKSNITNNITFQTNTKNKKQISQVKRRISTLNDYFPNIFKKERSKIRDQVPEEGKEHQKDIKTPNERKKKSKRNHRLYQTQLNHNEISTENNRWGDFLHHDKDDATIRIFYQNVNSIQCHSLEKWGEILRTIQEFKIDISGLSETCSNWSKPLLRNKFINKAKTIHSHSSIVFSENEYKCKDNFLPGGTLQITTGSWNSRIIETISDPQKMGRWSGAVYRLNQSSSLYVISAYRVCKQSISNIDYAKKSTTAYTQQYVMIKEKTSNTNSIPNPRKQFLDDLSTLIKNLKIKQSDHLIIMLDANEQIGDVETGLSKFINDLDLTDTILAHHRNNQYELSNLEEECSNCINKNDNANECNIATYNRGSKRIDYILSTRHTIPYIKRSGYLPFFEGFPSDHRGMFIDIDAALYDPILHLYNPPKRSIGTNCDRKTKLKYISYVNNEFNQQNIYKMCAELSENEAPWDEDKQRNFFDIDKKVIDIMIKAEEKCVVKKSRWDGNKDIHIARYIVIFWSIALRGFKTKRDTSFQLTKIRKKCPKEIQSQLGNPPLNQAYFLLKEAKNNLKKLKAEHKSKMEMRIANEMDILSLESGQKSDRLYKNSKQKETIKRTFNELKIILKSSKRSGISHIEVPYKNKNGLETDNPDEAVSWKIISDPIRIEEYIIDRNIKHFGQAQGSPFTVYPLATDLSYQADSAKCKEILNGKIYSEDTNCNNKYADMILEKIADEKKLKEINSDISWEEMRKGFQKWNENTSTSPFSKRHLGHIKVLVQISKKKRNKKKSNKTSDPSIQTDENEELEKSFVNINLMKEDIFKIIHFISNSAFKFGISLPRWKNVTTAMIEKIPGVPRINKLRVIHLYECDYNMMLKILWARKLVWHCHDNKRLNDGQSGSRPGRRALEVGLKKEMTYLYSRVSRSALATMDNDAKSCYDRIICNIAMLVSKYHGMPENACKTQAETLEKMSFKLRTALGDSANTYQHSSEKPIHGTGQGSCASPCIWLILCSILMDCLQAKARGMTIVDIIKSNPFLKQWIDGYVDDTALSANIELTDNTHETQSTATLTSYLTEIATLWNGLLEASGGKLELSKCFYYLLNWEFDSEGRFSPEDYEKQKEVIPSVSITDAEGKTTTIKQVNVAESHKTLGMWKTMIGDESDHIKHLQKQSDQITSIIAATSITRKQAKIAYNCIYIPKLIYSIPAFNLSCLEIESFQKKATSIFLSKMGFKNSFPRAMVFAPTKYGGLNVPHLYSESGIVKIQLLMSHIRAKSQLGQLMLSNINWIQLNLGLSMPILSGSADSLKYIDNNWFIGIRKFLHECNLQIRINNAWIPKLERKNDKILMDEFVMLGLTPGKMKLLNAWRLYFKVITLSDICDASGEKILPIYWIRPEQHIIFSHRSSNLRWPIQALPGPKGFSIWKQCLKTCFNMDERGFIQKPLGSWLTSYENSNSCWETYFDPVSSCIYKKVHNKIFKKHSLQKTANYISQFKVKSEDDIILKVPDTAYPIDVIANDEGITSMTAIDVIQKENITQHNARLSKSTWEKLIEDSRQNMVNNPIKNMIDQCKHNNFVFACLPFLMVV